MSGKSGLPSASSADELAVEDRTHRQLREEPGAVGHIPAAAADSERPLGRDDRAEAVPLHFVAPVAPVRELPGSGKHRLG